MIRYFSFLTGMIAIFSLQLAAPAQCQVLQNDEIVVFFEPPLDSAAGDVIRIYPELKHELEEMFGWGLDVRPQVVVVKDSRTFQKISRNKLFVAFAVPAKNLIVIDYSRMNSQPFSLSVTLKHELCHLLLHHHISNDNFAKWIDEGICQWASDGIGEIFLDKSWSGLDAAIMTGRNLDLTRLTKNFPRDKTSLMLAYEQSKSVVAYIDRQYGKSAILSLLGHLKNGETVDVASMKSLGISIDQLEKEWLKHLERTPRWLVFLANHIYSVLFFLAALLTVFGFIRRMMRKKAYKDWGEEDD